MDSAIERIKPGQDRAGAAGKRTGRTSRSKSPPLWTSWSGKRASVIGILSIFRSDHINSQLASLLVEATKDLDGPDALPF